MNLCPMRLAPCLALLCLAFSSGSLAEEGGGDISARAEQIARDAHIVDTHIDVPYALRNRWVDVSQAVAVGEFDLPRARQGGLNTPFMSIFTPASAEESGTAWQLANELIDSVEAMAGRAPDRFAIVASVQEAEAARAQGRIGLALGMENGAPIAGDLQNVGYFHRRGVRYITLAHSKSNHISDSSFGDERLWNGLSPFGRNVVAEMNRVGIMVDVSHISDEAFYQVIEISSAPVIASHSSARHFTPGFERNMSDDMIRALARNGGVIQINFGSSFLTAKSSAWLQDFFVASEAFGRETGEALDGPAGREWAAGYQEQHPFPFATLSELVDHFDHVVALAGAAHVGIGSDFDGVGDTLPVGMKDVSRYPALVDEFLRRGYSEKDITGILGGNLLRVWRAVEEVSARSGASGAGR